MKPDIQTSNIELNDHLKDLIQSKVDKLDHFKSYLIDIVFYLSDNGVNSKETEIKAIVKDQTLFCKEKEETLEKSIDKAIEKMQRQLRKYKEKKIEK